MVDCGEARAVDLTHSVPGNPIVMLSVQCLLPRRHRGLHEFSEEIIDTKSGAVLQRVEVRWGTAAQDREMEGG